MRTGQGGLDRVGLSDSPCAFWRAERVSHPGHGCCIGARDGVFGCGGDEGFGPVLQVSRAEPGEGGVPRAGLWLQDGAGGYV